MNIKKRIKHLRNLINHNLAQYHKPTPPLCTFEIQEEAQSIFTPRKEED